MSLDIDIERLRIILNIKGNKLSSSELDVFIDKMRKESSFLQIDTLNVYNGIRYIGRIVDEKFSNFTILIFEEGYCYVGSMNNNFPNGFGKFYYPDGSYYEGMWLNGYKNGVGKYFTDNKYIITEWAMGLKEGDGIIKSCENNNILYRVEYKFDVEISRISSDDYNNNVELFNVYNSNYNKETEKIYELYKKRIEELEERIYNSNKYTSKLFDHLSYITDKYNDQTKKDNTTIENLKSKLDRSESISIDMSRLMLNSNTIILQKTSEIDRINKRIVNLMKSNESLNNENIELIDRNKILDTDAKNFENLLYEKEEHFYDINEINKKVIEDLKKEIINLKRAIDEIRNENIDSSNVQNTLSNNINSSNQMDNENNICKICKENSKDVVLVPCHHLAACNDCYNHMIEHDDLIYCPICSREVVESIQIFL